jgi:hypothetical protein
MRLPTFLCEELDWKNQEITTTMSTPWTGSVFQKTSYAAWGKPQQSLATSILQNLMLHLFCKSNEGEKVVSLWVECEKCHVGLCTVAYKTIKQNWNSYIKNNGEFIRITKSLAMYVIRKICYASSNMILNKHMDTMIWHIAETSIWLLMMTEVCVHGVVLKKAWRVHSNEN